MMACWSTRNVLDLYVDRRLTAGAAARVRAHLEGCAECRQLERRLAPVRLPAGRPAPPPGLADAILRSLREKAEPAAAPLPAFKLAPAQAAALLYLGLLGAAQTGPGVSTQGLPQLPKAEAER